MQQRAEHDFMAGGELIHRPAEFKDNYSQGGIQQRTT